MEKSCVQHFTMDSKLNRRYFNIYTKENSAFCSQLFSKTSQHFTPAYQSPEAERRVDFPVTISKYWLGVRGMGRGEQNVKSYE